MASPDELSNRITSYFASCCEGSAEEISAHFTTDAVIYDTNHAPVQGADAIGVFWDGIRAQWEGAVWAVDSVVSDGETAAIEWHMRGVADHGPFVFRGSEHYAFDDGLIAEIRQYWTFDRTAADTGLQGYPYEA